MATTTETATRLAHLHQVREQSLRDLVDIALSAARYRPGESLAEERGGVDTPEPVDQQRGCAPRPLRAPAG